MTVVWALWVRGRLRPSIQIADGEADAVADLTPKGRHGSDGGTAVDRAGTRWHVETTRRGDVLVRRDGITWFTAQEQTATYAGASFTWDRAGDAVRRAALVRDDGTTALRARPGEGRRAPFCTFEIDAALTDPLPAVLGVSFTLLASDAIYGSWTSSAGNSTGP